MSVCPKRAQPLKQCLHLKHSQISCFANAYFSTHPGTACRCHGCRHIEQVPGGRRGPSAHQSTGAPKPALQWASRLHPKPASFPADQWLPSQMHKQTRGTLLMIFSKCECVFMRYMLLCSKWQSLRQKLTLSTGFWKQRCEVLSWIARKRLYIIFGLREI